MPANRKSAVVPQAQRVTVLRGQPDPDKLHAHRQKTLLDRFIEGKLRAGFVTGRFDAM
ncbi:hypothetical protein [Pseudomonas sp. Ost2]|uniref:hypothetical protein n=1 Tax=Pseudomonas sp. Ost2 TaxID=2678260 RepID=UPI001BB405C6|nr:hypothetical protein [Pseudomonas sp. Ost2]